MERVVGVICADDHILHTNNMAASWFESVFGVNGDCLTCNTYSHWCKCMALRSAF
jgi:hypothetical protein